MQVSLIKLTNILESHCVEYKLENCKLFALECGLNVRTGKSYQKWVELEKTVSSVKEFLGY